MGFKKLKEGEKGRKEGRKEEMFPLFPGEICVPGKEGSLSHEITRNTYTNIITIEDNQ